MYALLLENMAEGPSSLPPSASYTGTRVEESALPRLLCILSPVVHNWRLFARLIGVPYSQVSLIEAANPHPSPSSLYSCFDQSLEWWIANHHDPTYEAILAVLDPKRGETTDLTNRELAKQVKKFMAKEQGTFEEVFSESTSGPTAADDYTKQNIMVIQGKFATLLETVRKYLQKKMKKKKMKDLRLFILQLFPDISPDVIPKSSDLNEIFEAMRCNRLWSYMNYFSLEQIVKHFGGDNPEMIAEIEKFKKDRAGFQLATKIKAYISAAKACAHEQLNPVNPKHFTKLSHKLDERVADYSLKYLEELWQSLSFHMQLPPITLLFEIIDSGCIQIVFLIPTKLVPQVIHQAQHSAYFYEMHHRHVRSVTVGDICIYESKYTEQGSLVTMAMKQVIPEEEPMVAQTKDLEGGYTCDFVEPPPAGLQTECSVCLQILREPHIVDCCCYRFCQSCIDRIKLAGKSCPLCSATTFELMHDKQLERSLKDLKVRCIHAESGCKWTGELRQLDEHLNVNPEPETLSEGCGFIKIECIHCGHQCQRHLFTSHQCRKWTTHRGGHSPSLRELDQLPGVATVWYRLGLQLGVRVDDLDTIEGNYARDADMCKIKMFAEWLRGDTNPTYEKLVRALAAVGKRELAESICGAQGILPSLLDATADQSHITPSPLADEVLRYVVGCLMHRRDCQIPRCPCKDVQQRYREMLMRDTDAAREPPKPPPLDEKKHHLHLSLSQQNYSSTEHPHWHLHTKSHIRRTQRPPRLRQRSKSVDLIPITPVIKKRLTPAPINENRVLRRTSLTDFDSLNFLGEDSNWRPPLLLEISLSADNLPALCLDDCPLTPPPLRKKYTLDPTAMSPLREQRSRWVHKPKLGMLAENSQSTESSSEDGSKTSLSSTDLVQHISISDARGHSPHRGSKGIVTETLC